MCRAPPSKSIKAYQNNGHHGRKPCSQVVQAAQETEILQSCPTQRPAEGTMKLGKRCITQLRPQ